MQSIHNPHGPQQQALTINPQDYRPLNMTRLMLGIVLSVNPSDVPKNRTSVQRTDRRGYMHTCDVLIIQDGNSAYIPLENVLISSPVPTGLDDYYEKLPRGCSKIITGESFNSQMNHINPYDLDGDWCVVGFLAGALDTPVILSWFPHARNHFDPLTTGLGSPDGDGNGQALDQSDRYFRRVNGVEMVISKVGDLFLSTYYSNSKLDLGQTPTLGRVARTTDQDTGGSVLVNMKASQSFEMNFSPQIDGIGALGAKDDSLPQTNPQVSPQDSAAPTNTYLQMNQHDFILRTPENIRATSKKRIVFKSSEETTITVGTDFTVKVTGNTDIRGDGTLIEDFQGNVTINSNQVTHVTGHESLSLDSTFGGVHIEAGTGSAGNIDLTARGGSITLIGETGVNISNGAGTGGIILGPGDQGGVVMGSPLEQAFSIFASAVALAGLGSTDPAFAGLVTAVNALHAAVLASQSIHVTVG